MIESFGEWWFGLQKLLEGRILSEWSLDLQKLFGSWFWYILIPFTLFFDFPLRIGFEGLQTLFLLNFGPTGLKIGFPLTRNGSSIAITKATIGVRSRGQSLSLCLEKGQLGTCPLFLSSTFSFFFLFCFYLFFFLFFFFLFFLLFVFSILLDVSVIGEG
jgi:hypothetical protein